MTAEGRYDDQTRGIFEAASFGGRLTLGDTPAVLVVDFSCGFTDPEFILGADMTPAVEDTRRVLDAARAKGALIIYTTIAYHPHLRDAGLMIQKLPGARQLLHGTSWVEIDPRLGRRPDEPVVVKKSASAFFGTNVHAMLTAHGINGVVLCGAVTGGCIRATAIDLFQHGYPALVPRECVSDRAPGPQQANLFEMDARYVDVVSRDDAIAYLDGVPQRAVAD